MGDDGTTEKTPLLAGSTVCNLDKSDNERADPSSNNNKDEKPDFSFRKLDSKRKITFLTLGFVNFCACACFSLLAPFFPGEAKEKGASQTVIGLIFSCFEFFIFISSPIYGIFLTRIGPKFVFIAGSCVCGACAILFGLLDKSPPGTIFIVMCFLCRTIEALGAGAFITASFAIVAYSFPNNVATVFGSLETFSGLGMMVGPTIGGTLYQLGGYGVPFWTLGSLVLLCGFICYMVMPAPDDAHRPYQGSIFSLLASVQVWVTCFSIFCGAFALIFLDPTLSGHLEPFNLSPSIVGVIFLAAPGMYAATAPLWGWFGDKKGQVRSLMILGSFMSCIVFLLMGPTPLLPFLPYELWLIVVSLVMMGLFVGCSLIPTMNMLLISAKQMGFEENLDTYGLVSGLFNSSFCLGSFIGPTVGSALQQSFGFPWAATVMAGLFILSGTLTSMYVCVSKHSSCCQRNKERDYSIAYESDRASVEVSVKDEYT